MSTDSTKAWRGNFKYVYRSYSSTACVVPADKTAVNSESNLENILEVNPAVDGGLEAVYQLGTRTAKEILEGNINLTLRIRRRFIDRKMMHLAGIDSSELLPGKVCIGIFPHGYVSGKPAIYMCGKFANWSLPISQPDVEIEECDFIGECIETALVT